MSQNCDPSLNAGTTIIHPFEVSGGKYEPSKSVAGFRPGDGDTHGDIVLEVIPCDYIT